MADGQLGSIKISFKERIFYPIADHPSLQIIPLINQIFGDYELFKASIVTISGKQNSKGVFSNPMEMHEFVIIHAALNQTKIIQKPWYSVELRRNQEQNHFPIQTDKGIPSKIKDVSWFYANGNIVNVQALGQLLLEILKKLEYKGLIHKLIPGAKTS